MYWKANLVLFVELIEIELYGFCTPGLRIRDLANRWKIRYVKFMDLSGRPVFGLPLTQCHVQPEVNM